MPRAKKNVTVVENVNVESEEIKMENVVVENVVENADVVVADVVTPEENAVIPCSADIAADPADVAPVDVDADEDEITDDGNEKKQRKERAKINTDAFDVAGIVEEKLNNLLPAVVESMQGKENAETLAKAKLFSLGHDIIITLVNELEDKFKAYAKNSYNGKHPSYHWLLWQNTRKACQDVKKNYENELKNLYAVTDSSVYALLENDNYYVRSNARYTIDNFIECYVMQDICNLNTQVRVLDAAGVNTVYVPEYLYNREIRKALKAKGYDENDETIIIPERKYNGIDAVYPETDELVVFTR